MSTKTATETDQRPKELACPECEGREFSWVLEIVQFGSAYKDARGNVFEEGYKLGEVVGDDIENSGLYCTNCCLEFSREELVEVDD